MEVFEAVRTLLAVRQYEDKRVPADVIQEVIEAARLTASSTNRQEWDFIVIRERDRLEQLGELASSGGYIAGAAFAIALLVGEYNSAPIDAGRAAQDMMLTAWSRGVGSNWVGRVDTVEIRNFLNVPDDRMIYTIIPFGLPQEDLGAGVKDRKPVSEVVHAERYGDPYRA
jgi:nitroreductase